MSAHIINHTFREDILVPYVAVTDNIFLREGHKAVMSDGTPCVIEKIEHLHICGEQAEWWVTNLYKCDVWSFVKKWNASMDVSSMVFLHIKLKKDDR